MEKLAEILNDTVRPWDKLNKTLAEPFAYQPDLSDVTREAVTIATAIKHIAEKFTKDRRSIDAASLENSIMSDVADKWKHRDLRRSDRDNRLFVQSLFEVRNNHFGFLRNRVIVDHATHGQIDFMATAAAAIRYWLDRLEVMPDWTGKVHVAKIVFLPVATLYFDDSRQMNMESVRLQFLARADNGDLIPAAPNEVKFQLLDHKQIKLA